MIYFCDEHNEFTPDPAKEHEECCAGHGRDSLGQCVRCPKCHKWCRPIRQDDDRPHPTSVWVKCGDTQGWWTPMGPPLQPGD